jgi:plasmid stability protein
MASRGRKNITFSLPEDLIRRAKVYAAQHGTSVNAMVELSLERVVSAEDRHAAAVERLIRAAESNPRRSRSLQRWKREDLYDRTA